MPEQIEDQESKRMADETVSKVAVAAEKRIESVAEQAAEKSTKTVQRYDADHPIISK